ncbi:unnamed protein product [Fusarium equiseti]|uniref:Uncharacterized protein n=1 Tax=Fusarium equiseti TaxID=61235 RepID=A0A8J2NEK2_FUSEQ|nr:unnamed protein product [Fusarium equiseti]
MSSGHKRYHSHDAGPANEPSRTAKRCREPGPNGLSEHHEITPDKYTVGWVCALPLEMAAAKGMLDKVHPNPTEQDPSDHNTYLLGKACGHNVVVACLPAGIYGTISAATVAKDMLRTFKSIRFGLMVGIGGGIPSKRHDIRLGDVVVSQPSASNSGIIQYDRGNALQKQGFERTGSLNAPPQVLLAALSRLQAEDLTDDSRIPEFLANLPQKMKKRFSHPGVSNDFLYLAKYPHVKDNPTCEECDHSQTVPREERGETDPTIHYGTIASGSQVIKDSKKRGQIEKSLGALCVETEAAGLQDFPSIVIRGICDYADSHKNDIWQFYAAAVAAAFAKELLSFMPSSRVQQLDPIPQLISNLYTVHEACYDSENVGSSPRCEANTRVRIQQNIKQWADDETGESFLWLVGPAGTGKSTLIRSVADSFHEANRLVAGYFFKRGEQGRNDTNRLFSTLAVQLADAIPSFKNSLRASLGDTDKDSIDKKDLRFQFEKLLNTPIQGLLPSRTNEAPRIIVLDALDECERPDNLLRALAFISEICNNSRTLGFRVLLTSRPDTRIINAFEPLIQGGVIRKLQLHRVFSEDTKDDIRLYLETNFMWIKTKANIQQDPWPSVDEVDHLVELSTHPEPLFIYAATLLRFVYDERHLQNPKNQLKIWIKQCEQNESQLYQMYNPILEQIFSLGKDTDFDQQLQFLGALILVATPLSLNSITSLLSLDVDDVTWWLPGLHAVLDIPSELHKPIRLLHKSFGDFLLSRESPGYFHFHLEASETHAWLADRCIDLMERSLRRDICDLKKLDSTPDDVDETWLNCCIPSELQYSCLYWVHHIQAVGGPMEDGNKIYNFLLQHFLHWLEVLALLKRVSDGLEALQTLIHSIEQSSNCPAELVDFVKGAIRTISVFASVIEGAPLQTYASLILFSPVASRIRQQFWDQRLPPHSQINGVKSSWDARVQSLDVPGDVHSLALSPDGRFLVSAYKELRVWNVSIGSHLVTFEVDSVVDDVIFSPNGHFLAVNCRCFVTFWDTATWKELQTIKSSAAVITIGFSPNDEILTLVVANRTVQFWGVRSGVLQETKDLTSLSASWYKISISPSLEQLAIYSADDTVVLWSLVTDAVQHTFSIDRSGVHAMAISPDGGLLAVECKGIISIWDTATYTLNSSLRSLRQSQRLYFCSHGQLLASLSFQAGVKIWNLATGSCLNLGITLTRAFSFSSDNKIFATSSLMDGVTVWDLSYLDPEHGQQLSDAIVAYNSTMLFSPSGKLFASHLLGCAIQIWDVQTGTPVRSLDKGDAVESIRFSPDSKLLAIAGYSSDVWIWDMVDGAKQPMLKPQKDNIECPIAYSANSQLASVCWDNHTVDIYDATSGSYLSSLRSHAGRICSIALSPGGNLLASLSGNGTISLWDTKTRTCQWVVQQDLKLGPGYLKFSPDGTMLACEYRRCIYWWDTMTGLHQRTLQLGHESMTENGSQCFRDQVCLYNAKTAKHQSILADHSGKAHEIVFSPDSSKVAVASSDRTVRLWDTTTYVLWYTFDTHTDIPEMTRFSHDGSIIAVASRDKAIRLWHTRTGSFLQMNYYDGGFIQELRALDNKVIVSVSDVETDKLWDPWNTHTFKLSNHSYLISADIQTLVLERLSSEVSLDSSGQWVMRGEDKIINVPPEYRPRSPLWKHDWIKRGHILVYVSLPGKVIYLRLPLE